MKKFLFLACAFAAFVSCDKSDDVASLKDGEVRFDTSIATRTVGERWESGDQIGVYMTTNGGSTFADLGENILYTTTDAHSFKSTTPLYFPVKGSADFLSYYPYVATAGFDVTSYPVNVTNQADQGAIDLLCSNVEDVAKTASYVYMDFDHKLSRVYLNIKVKTESGLTAADLEGVKVSLLGTKAEASFDLTTDAVDFGSSEATEIEFLTNEAGTFSEAIVIPQALNGAKLKFDLDGDTYYATISTPEFEVGKEYRYNVTISNTEAKIGDAMIDNWGYGGYEDLDAEYILYPELTLFELTHSHANLYDLKFDGNATVRTIYCVFYDSEQPNLTHVQLREDTGKYGKDGIVTTLSMTGGEFPRVMEDLELLSSAASYGYAVGIDRKGNYTDILSVAVIPQD